MVGAAGSWACAGSSERACCFAIVSGESEAAELSNFTPSFLWLLRDFYLTLEEEGRTVRNGVPPLVACQSRLCVMDGAKLLPYHSAGFFATSGCSCSVRIWERMRPGRV